MATKSLVFATQYDEPKDVSLKCEDKSLTQQNFKDEVDINFLLEKFKVTGAVPAGVRLPQYGDFSQVSDYRSALDAVNAARYSFMELPANIRDKFANDPQRFLEFCSDPENADKLIDMGLATKPQETTVQAIHSLAKQMGPGAKPQGANAPEQGAGS